MIMEKPILAIIDGDHAVHQAEWNNNFAASKRKIDAIIDNILDSVFASYYKLAIKGDGNFRKELFSKYKGHRKRDNELEGKLNALLEYMIIHHGAVQAHGWEADDLCHQWQAAALKEDDLFPVICSNDKDMHTIAGCHYNYRKHTITHIDEDQADYFLNLQLLMGDSADNIKGIPKVGFVKATKMLEGIPMEHRREAVKEEYKKYFGSSWEDELLLNGNLVFIRSDINQGFSI